MKIALKWQTLIIVCAGIFMATLDGSILNIANPTIAEFYGVSMQNVQWVVTSYMLVITSTLLLLGKLGDRVGNHHIYRWGFLVFALGSLLCAMAPGLYILVAARCFQAIGASMLMATGVGIVSNTFPFEERGKALGITGGVVGLGNMVGPSLGGFLVSSFSWPVIFLINIPIGLLAFAGSYRYLAPQETETGDPGHDKAGNVIFALGIFTLILSLSLADGIKTPVLLAGMVLLVLFYLYERRAANPMLDFSLFQNQLFVIGNSMAFATYMAQTAVFFILPFYLENVTNFTPAWTGLLLTIPPVVQVVAAPLAGSLSDRLGPSRLTTIAFALMSGGFLLLSTLGTTLNLTRIILGLIIYGVGVASFGSPNSSSVMGSISRQKAGYAGGFMATVRNLGFAMGIAIWVSLFSFTLNQSQLYLPFAESYARATHRVFLCAGFIALAGLLVSTLTGSIRQNHNNYIET
ncbi:MAG: MFS transporter [Syntrophomonas sp.]